MQNELPIFFGESLFDYYKAVESSKIIIFFKGAMSQNTLIRIGDLIRLPAEEVGEENISKRLFAIMVEMAQNILYYSQEREFFPLTSTNVGVGIILILQLPTSYEIICGNKVDAKQQERLHAQCSTINSLNPEQLREYYSQQRRAQIHEGSKGGGLGLIDIVRKSKNPLKFSFQPISNEYSFFSLSTFIHRT
jgi:hypothetical protein